MVRHRRRGTDFGLSEEGEEEIFRLAQDSAELHYSHEIDIDIDAACADLRRRIPVQARPPQSRLPQARLAVSDAQQQVPRNWRAPIRLPYVLIIIALMAAVAASILLVYCYVQLSPAIPRADHVIGKVSPSAAPLQTNPGGRATDHSSTRPTHGDTEETVNVGGQQPLSPRPAGNSADSKPLAIDLTVGGKDGSLVHLDLTLRVPGSARTVLKANLGVAVDPAAAVCSITNLGSGDLEIPQLLATLKAPVQVEVLGGTGHPLGVQLAPTGIPAQPLGCSVLSPRAQSSTPAVVGNSAPLPRLVGGVLRSVNLIPLLGKR